MMQKLIGTIIWKIQMVIYCVDVLLVYFFGCILRFFFGGTVRCIYVHRYVSMSMQ
jgi:hypothetical protein